MRRVHAVLAAACLAIPSAALAQDDPIEIMNDNAREERDEGGNPRLGLLGLLGLAGLFGLFRREPDIHIDARRDPDHARRDSTS